MPITIGPAGTGDVRLGAMVGMAVLTAGVVALGAEGVRLDDAAETPPLAVGVDALGAQAANMTTRKSKSVNIFQIY